jgi:hypothetical protein
MSGRCNRRSVLRHVRLGKVVASGGLMARRATVVGVLVMFAVASKVEAQQSDQSSEQGAGGSGGTPKRTTMSRSLEVGVSSTYHADPFNLRKHWNEPADRITDPADRLFGYATPWDVITRVDLEVGHRWRLPSGARYGLTSGVRYDRYAFNPAHSRGELAGTASYRTPGRVLTTADFSWTLRTLQGNRRGADEPVFGAAYYSEVSVEIAQRREAVSGLSVRPSVEYAERRFEEPYAFRGRRTGRIATQLRYEPAGAAAVSATAGAGVARPIPSARSPELGRGLSFYEGAAVVHWRPQGDWSIRGRARARSIAYDAQAGGETAGSSRQDLLARVDVKGTRRLSHATALWLQLGVTNRTSERTADEVLVEGPISTGYFVRLGAAFTF